MVCTALDDGDHDIAAFVAADPAAVDASALRAACRSGLETWQRPTRYEVLATLPRNSNGKVDKPELLRRYPVPTAALAPAGAPC